MNPTSHEFPGPCVVHGSLRHGLGQFFPSDSAVSSIPECMMPTGKCIPLPYSFRQVLGRVEDQGHTCPETKGKFHLRRLLLTTCEGTDKSSESLNKKHPLDRGSEGSSVGQRTA